VKPLDKTNPLGYKPSPSAPPPHAQEAAADIQVGVAGHGAPHSRAPRAAKGSLVDPDHKKGASDRTGLAQQPIPESAILRARALSRPSDEGRAGSSISLNFPRPFAP